MRDIYIKKIIEMIHQLDTERLKKVYTIAKTLLDITQEEKKGGEA